jgi:hypothetical protein
LLIRYLFARVSKGVLTSLIPASKKGGLLAATGGGSVIRSREVIPTSLEHALIANRVLAALASGDPASEEARDAIEDGFRFLQSVVEGEQLATSRSVTVDSYKAALAYGESVKAFDLVAYQPGQVEDPAVYFKELLRYASNFQRAEADERAIQVLTNFFRTIRDIALATTERERPVETVSW